MPYTNKIHFEAFESVLPPFNNRSLCNRHDVPFSTKDEKLVTCKDCQNQLKRQQENKPLSNEKRILQLEQELTQLKLIVENLSKTVGEINHRTAGSIRIGGF